jgi:hypothetical protein
MDYMEARVQAMDKRIGELERSNISYAMQLYIADLLDSKDPNYVNCEDMHEFYVESQAKDKEDSRNLYYKEVTEGEVEHEQFDVWDSFDPGEEELKEMNPDNWDENGYRRPETY